ncbi:very short patch repair endonuclease [Nocardioides sp. CPCC 205120]|uniref:very short patch repair endonuclease n=1 Tax=Nocardioides sp. CPCC 205120 TaxID=3406462 RepID=UPI003B50A9F3
MRACSDSIDEAGAEKAPWKERKEAAIAHVADVPAEALLVLAADKLHNTRSTEADRAFHGSGVWTRFKAGRDGFLWYHLAELLVLEERVPESRSVRLLRRELSGLACGEAAGSPLATVANVPEEVRPFFAAGLLEEGWPGWGFGAGPEQDAFVATGPYRLQPPHVGSAARIALLTSTAWTDRGLNSRSPPTSGPWLSMELCTERVGSSLGATMVSMGHEDGARERRPSPYGVPPHPGASSTAVSRRMSTARRRDTTPELEIRRILHRMGLRYRVNLPVPENRRRTIDIAFTRVRLAVFIDGCFWHGCPQHGTAPRANGQWWRTKLAANEARDRDTDALLGALGWRVMRVWEHEDPHAAAVRIRLAVAGG